MSIVSAAIKRGIKGANPVAAATSKTTQNSYLSAGSIVAVLAFLRSVFPDLIPWPENEDGSLEGAVLALVGAVAVLGPMVGRVIAFIRSPEKAPDSKPSAVNYTGLMLAAVLGLSLLGAPGCKTIQQPDGTVITQPDVEAIQAAIVAAQASLDVARDALDLLEEIRDTFDDPADFEAERAERQERVELLQGYLDQLLVRLQSANGGGK